MFTQIARIVPRWDYAIAQILAEAASCIGSELIERTQSIKNDGVKRNGA